jgi:NAD-dependent dihydropyrimidine dehydrogenase PreA subunit
MIQVDQELCAGCGVCMQACSVDAIRLINDHAVIDHALCTYCHACVDACPNGAITIIVEPARQIQQVAIPEGIAPNSPMSPAAIVSEKAVPTRSLAPWAGAALTFLGQEVAPRLVDILLSASERRLAASAAHPATVLPPTPARMARTGRGVWRQARLRSRRNAYWNS